MTLSVTKFIRLLIYFSERLHSSNFDVKVVPRSARTIVENIDKILEILEPLTTTSSESGRG